MPVKKHGRTTGLPKGTISGLNATVSVQYDDGIAKFVKHIIITPGNFSAPGDSGSLIVADAKAPIKNYYYFESNLNILLL